MVIGQKQIHNRILQLNFRDCHAKISQVDAQATLGNGVVVQVTGELSNNGQPMRRFTQTFVLAAQSPKKYYVHNDIFRYQDYYVDEETEENGRSDVEEGENTPESSIEVQGVNSGTPGTGSGGGVPAPPPGTTQPIYYQSNVMTSATTTTLYQQQVAAGQQVVPAPMNGLHEEIPIAAPVSVVDASPAIVAQQNDVIEKIEVVQAASAAVVVNEEPIKISSLDINEYNVGQDDDRTTQDVVNQNNNQREMNVYSNEPKTYANLVKSGGGVGGTGGPVSFVPQSPPPPSASSTTTSTITSSNKFNQDLNSRYDPPLGSSSSQKPLAQRPMRGKESCALSDQ